MRSVIVGGAGFLGRALTKELVSRGHSVVIADRGVGPHGPEQCLPAVEVVAADTADTASLLRVFDGADEIYHLAGDLGTSELDRQLRSAVEANIVGSLNVFEAALRAHVPQVFLASKAHVWLNTYTATKHCAEQLARVFTQQHPVRICSLRFFNLYGPSQKLYPVRKLVPTFAAQALRGLPLEVYGDGEQTVDMLYVTDAAKLAVDYLQAGFVDRAVDCGSGTAMTVRAVADAVNEYFGNDAGIRHVPMRRGETESKQVVVADCGPLRSIVGPFELTPWDVALKETLRWYEQLDPHSVDAALSFHGLAHPFDGAWN